MVVGDHWSILLVSERIYDGRGPTGHWGKYCELGLGRTIITQNDYPEKFRTVVLNGQRRRKT